MAKKKQPQKKSLSTKGKVGIGVGLTAAAVSAAGAYFLYGSKHATKNRKAVKSWMLKAKAEVLEALEDAEEMTKEEYEELVEAIGGAYAMFKGATKTEISDFKKEMKSHWNTIEKSGATKKAKGMAKKALGKTKKTVKKVTKKPAKKKVAKRKK